MTSRSHRFLVGCLACLMALPSHGASMPPSERPKQLAAAAGPSALQPAEWMKAPESQPLLGQASGTRLLALPRLSEAQIRDLVSDILQELELSSGYRALTEAGPQHPSLPPRATHLATVVRSAAGQTRMIRFASLVSARRGPQLVVQGIVLGAPGTPNPDAAPDELDKTITKVMEDMLRVHTRIRLRNLQPQVIHLSYIDAEGALAALRAMGYSTLLEDGSLPDEDAYKGRDVPLLRDGPFGEDPPTTKKAPPEPPAAKSAKQKNDDNDADIPKIGAISFSLDDPEDPPGKSAAAKAAAKVKHPPTSIDYDRLPLIYKMPTPDAASIGLVGTDATDKPAHALGVSMVPSAASALALTVASSTSQLLVLTDPNNPAQFLALKKVLEEMIDKPARQVFVEGLVLEVSRRAFDELGIQWQQSGLGGGGTSVSIGTLVQQQVGIGQSALQIVRDTAALDPRQLITRINALVDSNKAEILSRPSVLTLDNRQATIRVGTDIPIATSKDASSGAAGGRVAFSFEYLPTGILLNIRPRIDQKGREISMVIDATVSSTVPGGDLRVVDPVTGITLASAPSISSRRVQTYARISNNTPLIIGGLVSRDQTKQESKVPGLGDIPVLGKLFGYESKGDERREVIIVLTPSIVTEEFRATKPQLPKDDDRFDLADMTLFREAYRIRAEDLIDSQYIRFNKRLLTYRAIANQVMQRNSAFERSETFSRFLGTRIPGEFIFVSGMMSRMLTRLKASDNVNIDKLMFFEGTKGASFARESVGGMMRRLGDGTVDGFFDKNQGKALLLRFTFARASAEPGQWATEPLAEVSLVDCPDRATWRKLLWDENQPGMGVQKHYTIVIHDRSDLVRLKNAIALKNTILNNGNERGTVFDNFLPGRMLAMQQVSPDWERTLEGTVARYFFYGELFYPAFADEMERAIAELDKALRLPEMARHLDGIQLP
jgi:general secretion pathway protein D